MEMIKFVSQLSDESLWQMLDDYEKWKKTGTETTENSLLRNKTREFCTKLNIPIHYHTDFMSKIAMEIYKHFAMRYKSIKKDT